MLKPEDIQSKEFEIKLRGYDRDQVDDFLDELIRDFAVLYKDNSDLTTKLEEAQAEISALKARSDEVEKSRELARYQCEEMKKNAQEQAQKIIEQAKEQASTSAADVTSTREKLKAICTEFLNKIENI